MPMPKAYVSPILSIEMTVDTELLRNDVTLDKDLDRTTQASPEQVDRELREMNLDPTDLVTRMLPRVEAWRRKSQQATHFQE